MKDVFFVFAFFVAGSVALVSILSVMVVFLTKWNAELREQVKQLQPPF